MSTRSNVGKMLDDGTFEHIYVHYDGYVNGVGKMLFWEWNNDQKIDELLKFGDIAILKPYPYVGTFQHYVGTERVIADVRKDVNSEPNSDAVVSEFDRILKDVCIEYIYVWFEGEWWVKVSEDEMIELSKIIGCEIPESEVVRKRFASFKN